MMFWETQMHIVTFCITMFELGMLFFQVIHFLERTDDRNRLMYLILLLFLIAYNVCSGLFPDEKIPIPIALQNILAFFVGFAMSMFVVYYFYKVFELKHLKFFATYGIFLFLFIPFLVCFALPYLVTGDLGMSRKLTVIIPFLYGLGFVYNTTRALFIKFKEYKLQGDPRADALYTHAIAAYISVVCWACLPVIVFFGDFQVLEHSVTNAGFLLMSLIYVRSSIQQSRMEYVRLLASEAGLKETVKEQTLQIEQLNDSQKEIFIRLAAQAYMSVLNGSEPPAPAWNLPTHQPYENSFKKYQFSPREIQVLLLLIKGHPYKTIADELNISEKTVSKHISNIFAKTGVANKVELINKLLPNAWEPLAPSKNGHVNGS